MPELATCELSLADACRLVQESLERREELLSQQEQLAAARWILYSTQPLSRFSASDDFR